MGTNIPVKGVRLSGITQWNKLLASNILSQLRP